MPPSEEGAGYIKVHPNFRAIFTSNPHEYLGVHKTQDALLDRMVSMHLDYFDEETERAIVVARTGVTLEDAKKIVGILRDFRQIVGSYQPISIRPGITIGKILRQKEMQLEGFNPLFVDICVDALISGRHNSNDREKLTEIVISLVHKHFQGELTTHLSNNLDDEVLEILEATVKMKVANVPGAKQKENNESETDMRQFRTANS